MIGLGLAITDNIKRYSMPMFLFKKNLLKNRANAFYDKKINKGSSIRFDGVFLLKEGEDVEILDSNVFTKEIPAKVYTLDDVDFRVEEQVLVEDDFFEIVSINKYYNSYVQKKVGYIVLVLKKL
ncbi:hypothetical protein bcCo53_001183 (plasmid) [Borrelia coriaceae]|nr:hypothetical protein [Borrelia coriaceae]UPA17014.1 hypothetical protein bcCo53_001183 [Borrelia coriaceae]